MSLEFEPDSETQQCPVCHSIYPVGVAVCAFCGSPLPMAQASAAELHPPLPPPILPDTPEPTATLDTPIDAVAPVASPVSPGQDGAQAEATVTPRWCAFCGWGSPPEAERCLVCGAAFPLQEAQAEQRALLALQLDQARARAIVHEADERRSGRWRWAAWGLSRLWRST
jgi:hypothetical protein